MALKLNVMQKEKFTAARNTCKLCAPLGASLVFRGIEGCVPLVHGSQGCATYIRRYLISHFREPVDIASSNFSEVSAIFGGGHDLFTALDNIILKYQPAVIGITSTCLSETMGEDVDSCLKQYRKANSRANLPLLIHASTPSYRGDHLDGFHAAVGAVLRTLACGKAEKRSRAGRINVVGGFFSCADIRTLHSILNTYNISYMVMPDYADTLDGASWENYITIPAGGTPLSAIRSAGNAVATLVLGGPYSASASAARDLKERSGTEVYYCEYPIGIGNTDSFCSLLGYLSGTRTAKRLKKERGRLVDAYIDAHKYLAGLKAVIYGEADLVCGLAAFLDETGIQVSAVATGSTTPEFVMRFSGLLKNTRQPPLILQNADFTTYLEQVKALNPDLVIGNSKGMYLAERLGIPLVRCGFPVHDRFGAQRIRHIGYSGTLELFDRIVNTVMENKKTRIRYSYL